MINSYLYASEFKEYAGILEEKADVFLYYMHKPGLFLSIPSFNILDISTFY